MERLTEEYKGCIEIKKCNHEMCRETCESVSGCANCPIQEAIIKLASYEDAEEQGLLIRLPVAIGSRVYSPTRDFVSEYTICGIEIYKEGFFFNWICEKGMYSNVRGFTNHAIGKTVFLTREEAEAALAKMKGE